MSSHRQESTSAIRAISTSRRCSQHNRAVSLWRRDTIAAGVLGIFVIDEQTVSVDVWVGLFQALEHAMPVSFTFLRGAMATQVQRLEGLPHTAVPGLGGPADEAKRSHPQ